MVTTTMNTQKMSYERALARAHSAGLEITGQGHMRTTGDRFLLIPSATEPGRSHVVVVEGARLHCNCQAGSFGRMCQHRALAHEYLVHESEQKRALGAQRAHMEQEERAEARRRSPDGCEPSTHGGQNTRHAPKLVDDSKAVSMLR
jgi:hypothetical protein